ncbi:class I SAM-dependent methyltransferase [Galbibacter pacificus]|uniref:Class I SAM-dependent methyltransferase n=1 Tax=Galbibacter pacificus TaxID=2996052 RepID=A0ABT6FNU4_9FLAO|nr:class I SAM-dependent methyltransferase [Galbibacter pacificus]MDG3581455.1 class I SAM-dependent methyltransferase [Galbibacter pacificus]MDG3584933.1 class I SAM-dependent methyltransferase [Galbibacter pacificus]
MKKKIDRFSTAANLYLKYRPVFPKKFLTEICNLANGHGNALDVGTGNGQVAMVLSTFFKNVEAIDISKEQLNNAVKKSNIHYHVSRAEQTSFSSHQFNIITVGQAFHWFDFNAFYKEAARIIKPGGILAIFGYGLIEGTPIFNQKIKAFYQKTEPYWDPERAYIDAQYKNIDFPYTDIALSKPYYIEVTWTAAQLKGYLNSWSAIKKIKKDNPVDAFIKEITAAPTEKLTLKFPVFYRIARIGQ